MGCRLPPNFLLAKINNGSARKVTDRLLYIYSQTQKHTLTDGRAAVQFEPQSQHHVVLAVLMKTQVHAG